jgi:hypothetical protein
MSRTPRTKGLRDPFSILPREMSWRKNASCSNLETSKFFATPMSSNIAVAIAICKSCPVRAECFEESMLFGYHGVWGGSTHDQRIVITKDLLHSDLTNFNLQKAISLLSVVDSIGKTKDTATADLVNYNYTDMD